MKRRDFVKTMGATGVALYASDLVADLLARFGRVAMIAFGWLSGVSVVR
jgi:hypothetical protein